MARIRKVQRHPPAGRNYYVVDACFLANKHIASSQAPAGRERDRIQACHAWWDEITDQLNHETARVYVPDICIAEAFKVLAKKYYIEGWFRHATDLDRARRALSDDVRTESRTLKRHSRKVRFHDISTNRDIIIGVDRFFEVFLTNGKNVSIPDLILLATAKYVMDFYDLPKDLVHIVTMDTRIREVCARLTDLPNAYDPTLRSHRAAVVFQ